MAESKDVKLRERLTGDADANPEPSSKNSGEGAETERRICIDQYT